MRSPIPYFGGKRLLAKWILEHFPKHEQYCEPYFGGGSILFRKEQRGHETINDIDEYVTNFFRVLRDDGERFIDRAMMTEFGEGVFKECRETFRTEEDPLLKAWKWWVVSCMCFSGWIPSDSFSVTSIYFGHSKVRVRGKIKAIAENAYRFLSRWRELDRVIQRLRSVQILCCEAQRAVTRCDTFDCLHYLDPPYYADKRGGKRYRCDMSVKQHTELIRFLLSGKVEGKVVLSGYSNPLYSELEENGWKRVDKTTYAFSSARSGVTNQRLRRVESLWLCPRTTFELFPHITIPVKISIRKGKIFLK
jgi:DNA adenine methylase